MKSCLLKCILQPRPPVRVKLAHWFEMTAISVYATQEKNTANRSRGQAQLPWHLITCTTVSILPASLQQICPLFPLTITRIKLCIYFHTFTSTADQFSHTNVLLSSDLTSSCSLRTEPKSCLCKNSKAWCIHTNLLDKVIKNFFKAAVPRFKMMHHKLYHKNSMLTSQGIYIQNIVNT